MRRPAPARLPSAIDVSVDLPMPGEPPSRTSEPGTSPPPSTRSSSPIPVFSRGIRGAWTSDSVTGLTARPAGAPVRAEGPRDPPGTATSSLSVFHSPQPGHCPIHFAEEWAQAEQTKRVVGRAISGAGGTGV